MRVLELSDTEGAAAYAGKLFARWGGEVIRVESPQRLSPKRSLDLYLNGGKQRFLAEFREERDREAIGRLAASCDMLITDVSAADQRDFGLLNLGGDSGPAVRVSITPFGLSGPYADYPATNATLLALGGYSFFMGDAGRPPLTMPGNYPLYQAGGYAYVAGLASAIASARTKGESALIEVSILETLVSLHQMTDTRWIDGGHIRRRRGSSMEVAGNTLLPVKDGWVGISVGQQFWAPFATMIGRPDVAQPGHPMAAAASRANLIDEVIAMATEALSDWPAERVFFEGQQKWRVPLGRLLDMKGVLEDGHLAARGFWRPIVEEDGTELPGVLTAGSPFTFGGEERPVERAPQRPRPLDSVALDALAPSRPTANSAALQSHRAAAVPARVARPLEGVRILDLTRIWAGPVAGRILGDLGAQVIKIEEANGRGPRDALRGANGYQAGVEPWEPWNHQSLFNKLNRNRQSICLDLKQPEGRELFLRLAGVCDVVLENFSARAMDRLGLGYEQLRAANERVILVPMPAYGKRGPYRDFIGLGPSVEPLSGLPSLMGYPGGEPKATAKAVADAIAGVAGAIAVLTALDRRERTGLGAEVDLSQHEGVVAMIGEYIIDRQLTGFEPERVGNWHADYAPHGIYRCQGEDDWIAIAARNEQEWATLAGIAAQGWESDPRFSTSAGRLRNREPLDQAIEGWTCQREKLGLMAELGNAGVPAGAVLNAAEYLADPHLNSRGYYADVKHPVTGVHRYDGSPLTFHAGKLVTRGYEEWLPPPRLGEHNWALLDGLLGMSEAEYQGLVARGVLKDRPPAAV